MSDIQYLYSSVKDLPDDLYKTCLWHNLQGGGQMQSDFVLCRKSKSHNGHVIMLWNKEMFVGWGLLINRPWRTSGRDFFIFVPKKFRNKGYGTIIYRLIRKHYRGKIVTHPWSDPSTAFFKKVVNTKNRSIDYVYTKNNYT